MTILHQEDCRVQGKKLPGWIPFVLLQFNGADQHMFTCVQSDENAGVPAARLPRPHLATSLQDLS